eukprot:3941024-Rhodomonas_salina.3
MMIAYPSRARGHTVQRIVYRAQRPIPPSAQAGYVQYPTGISRTASAMSVLCIVHRERRSIAATFFWPASALVSMLSIARDAPARPKHHAGARSDIPSVSTGHLRWVGSDMRHGSTGYLTGHTYQNRGTGTSGIRVSAAMVKKPGGEHTLCEYRTWNSTCMRYVNTGPLAVQIVSAPGMCTHARIFRHACV